MRILHNPYRAEGRDFPLGAEVPFPSVEADRPLKLLSRCPAAAETPLSSAPGLAAVAGIGALWLKDERGRMGLGSFKALGAAYVIASDAAASGAEDLSKALSGVTYATASAGNHGLSVAAGARVFGAASAIFIAETVPESFAERLEAKGATVIREGADYEASMAAAAARADAEGWRLLSDSSWPGYFERPHKLMEGYLAMMAEAADQIDAPPTHILLQAGVGGLAGACAAYARARWGDGPRIAVVEPAFAPALFGSIEAGAVVETPGPVSAMGRLDCKEPSLIALKGLARDADDFILIEEAEAAAIMTPLAAEGFATTPSGGGAVSLITAPEGRAALEMNAASRVMAIISEAPE